MIKAFSRAAFGVSLVAFAAAALAVEPSALADNAPDTYTVKRGDTLWAISGVFLKQPWRWPELWKMNQDQIRNPHLIYPGQIVVLDRRSGTLSLGRSVGGSGEAPVERLSPQVYATDANSPIASVPFESIRPFLTEPLVSENEDSPELPTVVAVDQERVVAGAGDVIYAKNLNDSANAWYVYRRGKPIKDPVNEQILGYEAQHVATAEVSIPATADHVAELRVISSKHEVVASDRLVPATKSALMAIPPHAPVNALNTTVADIHGGVGFGGRNSIIAVSGGRNLGIEPGNVLSISRNNGTTIYRGDDRAEVIALPDSRIGLLYVFRVFDRISYGLIVQASGPVKVGDKLAKP